MTAETQQPEVGLRSGPSARWERLPGGPLLGFALGLAFSATCWGLVLLLCAKLLG